LFCRINLPPNWEQYFDDEGFPYYYNTITGCSQWEVPLAFGEALPPPAGMEVEEPEPELPPPPKGSVVCGKCYQGFRLNEQRLTALGQYWHLHCFICNSCSQPFSETFVTNHGKPYHPTVRFFFFFLFLFLCIPSRHSQRFF
jgi:hypothetical protein